MLYQIFLPRAGHALRIRSCPPARPSIGAWTYSFVIWLRGHLLCVVPVVLGCRRTDSTNGHFESLGDMMIRGMYTLSPTCVPVIICVSMYLFPSCVIVILVPLHKPAAWLMLRSSITGKPTFSVNLWSGIPGDVKVLRNSVGCMFIMMLVFVVALHTVSRLRHTHEELHVDITRG
ncbi:uncharacterized protein LOC123432763 isoform X3 [Hordeum vulgare subsp. vulgare]|uniref:uncharacterized protein LOC123432763 isoform X3 n=1 Tax=Hordeum vulgare subsp. vulgare TaxID=112509 RepID=UPI001D1A4DDC|nr:uncharacterized protein LOC123432763 isoform X3 [Hordeum vulgare subsp. vulgare]